MANDNDWDFATRAVHTGDTADSHADPITPPITLSTAFRQSEVGEHDGYRYSRRANPNRDALESTIASLESAHHGLAFSSGVAAEDAVLRLLHPGDHVIVGTYTYAGTVRLMEQIHSQMGIEFSTVDLGNPKDVTAALRPTTRLVWADTPSNPLLDIVDIAALADGLKESQALLAIDNTVATPYLQNPLHLGADVAVHSSSKYLGGHADVIGGAIATNNDEVAERLRMTQLAAGAVPSPFDCYLLLRGIETLALRLEKQCDNAETLAAFLVKHDKVQSVNYPFLETHKNHDVARKQMRRGGGLVSFSVGSKDAATKVAQSTRLFALTVSFGATKSLIEHCGDVAEVALGRSVGIDEGLLRVSVGIESADDLREDLSAALDVA